jgi:hypothetical protein
VILGSVTLAELKRAAVVTGGARGIGLEIVRHLAEDGMCVVAIDRDSDACIQARRTLAMGEDRVRIITGDIGTLDGARMAIETSFEIYGRLDLLCNNAAVHPLELLEEHALETWSETFRVNVDGTMLCSQARAATDETPKIGSYCEYRLHQRAGALRPWKCLRRLQSGNYNVNQGLGLGSRALRGESKLYLPRVDPSAGSSR